MVKIIKQRHSAKKMSKRRVGISITSVDGYRVLRPKMVDDSLPYLSVDKHIISDKALLKKRKQICHELDNTTAIVLKELEGI